MGGGEPSKGRKRLFRRLIDSDGERKKRKKRRTRRHHVTAVPGSRGAARSRRSVFACREGRAPLQQSPEIIDVHLSPVEPRPPVRSLSLDTPALELLTAPPARPSLLSHPLCPRLLRCLRPLFAALSSAELISPVGLTFRTTRYEQPLHTPPRLILQQQPAARSGCRCS